MSAAEAEHSKCTSEGAQCNKGPGIFGFWGEISTEDLEIAALPAFRASIESGNCLFSTPPVA
jgi:hypothetical protein